MKIKDLSRCKCGYNLKPHWDYKGYNFIRSYYVGQNPVYEIWEGTSEETFHQDSNKARFDYVDEAWSIRGCIKKIEEKINEERNQI